MQIYNYFLKCLKQDSKQTKLDKKTIAKHYKIIFDKYYDFLETRLYIFEDRIVLELNYNIVPASRPRVGKKSSYYAQPYRGFKEFFKQKVTNLLREKASVLLSPLDEIHTPIALNIIEYRRISDSNLSVRKVQTEKLFLEPDVSTPDLDNIEKSVLDAFNGVLFADDCSVYKLSSEKYTNHNDFTRIEIYYRRKIANI